MAQVTLLDADWLRSVSQSWPLFAILWYVIAVVFVGRLIGGTKREGD